MSVEVYPEELGQVVRRKHYIPRKLEYKEHLKQYKKYWLSEQCIKVEEVYFIKGTEYYQVRFPQKMFGQISYPVDCSSCYELKTDHKEIYKLDCIINTNKSYTGAEIKYWFYTHHINEDTEAYNEFWSFLDPNSKNVISDSKFYFLFARICDGKYINCRVCLDREKSKPRRHRR